MKLLTIENIEKAIRVKGCSVQIKEIQRIETISFPQRTYDILFTHKDFPKSEFFLAIDRESGHIHSEDDNQNYWPCWLNDLNSPYVDKFEVNISEYNLSSTKKFLDFIDTVTQVHKH